MLNHAMSGSSFPEPGLSIFRVLGLCHAVGWLTVLVAVATSQLTSEPAAVTDVELFDPKHYSASNLYGSRGGGTRLRLVGNGLLNPDGSFDATTVVTIGGQPATPVPFLSSSTQLVVDTPRVSDSTPDCCHEFKVRHDYTRKLRLCSTWLHVNIPVALGVSAIWSQQVAAS